MSNTQVWYAIVVIVLVTALTRFLPFILLSSSKKTPKIINKLGFKNLRTLFIRLTFSILFPGKFSNYLYYITITNVPSPINMQPIIDLTVNCSCRNTNAKIKVITTLNLSIGTTFDTFPICSAL